MKKPAAHVVALGVGLVCAGLLLWLWRGSVRDSGEPAASGPATADTMAPPTPDASPAPASTLEAETRAILARLQRALARRDTRPREALLAFKDEAAMRRFVARAQKRGLTVISQAADLRTARVRFDRFNALQDELLQNAGDYADISANYTFNVPTVPAKEDRAAAEQVPFRNDTLTFLGITGDFSHWGRGTTIAILDTGVAADATFGPGRLRALDLGLGMTPGTGPDDGHGTAVAALAGGLAPDAAGVAPAANLLSIRVTDTSGTSDIFTVSQGIVAAVNAGAKIINISLGSYATGAILEAALTYATERGALIVAAAGNDQAAQLAWPAAYPGVISVGAVDKAEQQVTFSNSGSQLQLSAPGYGVQTAWLDGARAYVDGTSASAPLVAGAIAAVMSQNASLTAQQAADLLMRTASDGGAPGVDPAFGRGILNLGWAMNSSNPGYVDTAVSTHYYDAANNQMQFVVQNRSALTVSGLTLTVSGASTSTQSVPSLAPGESYVARVPVNDVALKSAGRLAFTTQLVNPAGLVDRVPANNRKSSILTPPGKP
jgi:hypothetical protein